MCPSLLSFFLWKSRLFHVFVTSVCLKIYTSAAVSLTCVFKTSVSLCLTFSVDVRFCLLVILLVTLPWLPKLSSRLPRLRYFQHVNVLFFV